ncbi:MAG: hypothetical protein C0601_02825 [Candidatus Muiribacterium halophilum]|uniref:Uncharacterized protein n=1 Tax=Muiribacterium halophilum TaxID=2053465 RepID=A0A2N5ZK95_MUIH1|nr:MAG: hypothetical protein C0601_02825 [Candidatus Muirbacterium halophilum]
MEIPPFEGNQVDQEKNNITSSSIVSEFFSENVSYYEIEGIDLEDTFNKLDDPKHMANLAAGYPGIETVEKNRDYIKMERAVLIQNKIVKFDKGMEQEDTYKKLQKCKIYIFEDFIAALGDAKAIKDSIDFISSVILNEIMPMIPSELIMLKLESHFKTIENVTIERIKHSNIRKMTIAGKANDLSDLDINFPGFDIASISGMINTGLDERRVKVTKTGKVNFSKVKDKPIYIEHIKYGHKLLASQ